MLTLVPRIDSCVRFVIPPYDFPRAIEQQSSIAQRLACHNLPAPDDDVNTCSFCRGCNSRCGWRWDTNVPQNILREHDKRDGILPSTMNERQELGDWVVARTW